MVARIALAIAACIVALVIVAQPIAAHAAAGWRADATCCCPDLAHCKCPHGTGGNDAPMLRTCGDAGHMALPELRVIALAPPAPILVAPAPVAATFAGELAPPGAPSREPETPPF